MCDILPLTFLPEDINKTIIEWVYSPLELEFYRLKRTLVKRPAHPVLKNTLLRYLDVLAAHELEDKTIEDVYAHQLKITHRPENICISYCFVLVYDDEMNLVNNSDEFCAIMKQHLLFLFYFIELLSDVLTKVYKKPVHHIFFTCYTDFVSDMVNVWDTPFTKEVFHSNWFKVKTKSEILERYTLEGKIGITDFGNHMYSPMTKRMYELLVHNDTRYHVEDDDNYFYLDNYIYEDAHSRVNIEFWPAYMTIESVVYGPEVELQHYFTMLFHCIHFVTTIRPNTPLTVYFSINQDQYREDEVDRLLNQSGVIQYNKNIMSGTVYMSFGVSV